MSNLLCYHTYYFPHDLLLNIQANDDKESVDQAASNLHSSWLLPIQTVSNATTHNTGAAAVDARQDHQEHRRNDNRTTPEDISLHVCRCGGISS